MKKILNVALFLLFIGASANAQFFVGGSFSFDSEGGSREANGNKTDKKKTSAFVFAPKAGYFLTEKFALGAQLIVSTSKETTPIAGTDQIEKTSTFGIAPFARYYALNFNKFSLFGEARLGLLFGSSKSEFAGVTDDGPSITTIGFDITPGIAFALSEKVELEGKVNLFNLGIGSTTEKTDNGNNNETIDKTTQFGFGAGLDDVVNTGDFSIGLIIKF